LRDILKRRLLFEEMYYKMRKKKKKRKTKRDGDRIESETSIYMLVGFCIHNVIL